jgi:hypothetical protein
MPAHRRHVVILILFHFFCVRARTRELPGNHPFSVKRDLIREVTTKWLAPAKALCRETHAICLTYIQSLIKAHFEHFGQGILEQRVQYVSADFHFA